MGKFVFDQNKKQLTIYLTVILLFIVSIILMIGGLNRFSISGEKNEKGRIEISITDYFLLTLPYKSEEIAPVTNARLFTDTAEDKSLFSYIIIFTTKDIYELDGERADYSDEEKSNTFNDLDLFISDPEKTEFSKSFFKFKASGILGLIMLILSLFYLIPRMKKINQLIIAEAKNIDFSKPVKIVQEKIEKKETKNVKEKETKTFEITPEVSRTLRILIPAFRSEIKFDFNVFKIPETDEIALLCTSDQKADLEQKYKHDFKFIICDNVKGTADMVLKAQEWLQDYTGYLFVPTMNMPDLSSAQISKIFKDHREKDCECTFLTKENTEIKIPKGKVLRSVANKIIKISETEEMNDVKDQPAEAFAGLFCFNTKNLYKVLNKMNISSSTSEIPLTRIIEIYYKNGYRVNSFMTASTGRPAKQDNQQPAFQRKSEPEKKSRAILILDVERSAAEHAKSSFDMASSIIDIDRIGIITSPDRFEEFKIYFDSKAEIMTADRGLGDGFDVLKAQDWLKDFKGDIIVIPENNSEISSEMINLMISEHTERENTCTYIKLDKNNMLCCVNSMYFFYAAKRIIRDDDTKQYYLSQITDILINDKKRVQEIAKST